MELLASSLAPAHAMASHAFASVCAAAPAHGLAAAGADVLASAAAAIADVPAVLAKLIDADKVEGWVGYGGPWVIFGLLFLCGLGLPVPEEIPILAAGYFISIGRMGWVLTCVLAWAGVVGGDCILYWLGRRLGLNITKIPLLGKHFTGERILKAERLFERWGVWVIAVGRLISGIRGVMCVAAGAIRYNFIRFLVVDGLAALVSGGIYIGLGFWLGRKLGDFDEAVQTVEPYVELFLTSVVFVLVVVGAYLYVRHRRRRGVSDVALEQAVKLTEKLEPPPDPLGTPIATHAVVGK
ncbi:MAG: rane protein [Phycisphaerales bacterium]|nr:rane protein [Phycisphaerales bacterium]